MKSSSHRNTPVLGKLALFVLLALCLISFFFFVPSEYRTLDYFQTEREALLLYTSQHFIFSLFLYVAAYTLLTALSLPGAALMTVAGGALFGFWPTTIAVSFASTLGATAAFSFSRYLFREAIKNRFWQSLEQIDHGIEQEGGFYLFALRLVPVFPFFLVNLLMGLTRMRVWTFFLVSQLGMLPGTMVYVFAGTNLGETRQLGDIFSFELLLAFGLLGILPLVSKKSLQFMRASRILKNYPRPKRFDFNLVAIGGGSAGLVTAYISAIAQAKVALIEREKMGGDCLNTGCVPSKALLKSASVAHTVSKAEQFGIRVESSTADFEQVMKRVQTVISQIEPHDSVERYRSLGVECLSGDATILDPYRVQLGEKIITTRSIVIATGASPSIPDIPGLSEISYVTSKTLWEIRKLPKHLVVVGGGPVGCEMAQAFRRLGSRVTVIQEKNQLLEKEEPEAAELLLSQLKREGVEVILEAYATRFLKANDEQQLFYTLQEEEHVLSFDLALLAVGRTANTTGLGLEALGIELRPDGTIQTDRYLRTRIPNIYACGDVTGPFQLTHAAAHQAWYAAINGLFSPLKHFAADYRVVPRCTFTDPEVASVGLTRVEAEKAGLPHEIHQYDLRELDRAIAEGATGGFVRVLTPPKKDIILGVTIVGKNAGETLSEFVLAMKQNLGLSKILSTIHSYPTMAEGNKYAAGEWKRAHAPKALLDWVRRFHEWRRG